MELTYMLAQIWGPILLAIGVGFFLSSAFYKTVYGELEKESFAVLFFGMIAMAVGIAHVMVHNTWDSLAEIVVSLLGWALLVKGIVCVVAPRLADKMSDMMVASRVVPMAGIGALLLGGYLTWIGYLM